MLLSILDFGDTARQIFISMLLTIDGLLYGFIDKVYQIFMALAGARILTDDTISTFIDRVYIVVGVVMIFALAYSILTAIVNPDNINKGDTAPGKILQNVVIAVVFLAITPAVFNFLYRIQDVVLEQNVVGKLILGPALENDGSKTYSGSSIELTDASGNVTNFNAGTYDTDNSSSTYEIGGRIVAYQLFSPFFTANTDKSEIEASVKDYFVPEWTVQIGGAACALSIGTAVITALIPGVNVAGVGAAIAACSYTAVGGIGNAVVGVGSSDSWTLEEAEYYAAGTGDFSIFQAFSENVVDGQISYTFIVSSIIAIIVLYVFISFCLDLGLRAAKLAYFQLIAPIPILMRVMPKGGKVFDTWLKKVISTFAEVFIRIFIIYFVVYLITSLPDLGGDFWSNSLLKSPSTGIQLFARAFIILGLIVFAKQAPKLISEMFGIDSGGIKLGIREKLADAGVMRGGAAIGAGVQSAVKNFNNQKGWRRVTSAIGGLGGGAVRGFNSAKDAKTFSAMNKARAEAVARTEARREGRTERRNYLNSMTDEYGHKLGWFEARATNAADSVKSWAGLGPSTKEYELYDKMQKQEKDIKDATEKLFAKYDKKSFLVDMNGKFKGDNAARAQRLWETYISAAGYNMSYGEAEAQLKQMQARDVSGLTEAEQIEHARDVKAMESMLSQLKKNSIINMENEIYNARNRTSLSGTTLDGMKIGEIQEVAAKVNVFAEEFNRSGIKRNADGTADLRFDGRHAGDSSDTIGTEMGNYKTKISQEIERQKRREAATKGGK